VWGLRVLILTSITNLACSVTLKKDLAIILLIGSQTKSEEAKSVKAAVITTSTASDIVSVAQCRGMIKTHGDRK
jgi:hypothetical protein